MTRSEILESIRSEYGTVEKFFVHHEFSAYFFYGMLKKGLSMPEMIVHASTNRRRISNIKAKNKNLTDPILSEYLDIPLDDDGFVHPDYRDRAAELRVIIMKSDSHKSRMIEQCWKTRNDGVYA